MGLNGNSSDKQVVQEAKLYTGLTNMKVVGINPTKAELEALGYKPQQEPVYLSEENGVKKVRIDFYLTHKEQNIRAKVAFFLENKVRVNQNNTKCEWINNYGRSVWGGLETAPDTFKWFDPKTARKAKVGEADIHTFLINWLNIAPTDEAKLDKFDALFLGDYSELKTLLRNFPTNEVRVLLTVKDGKYQSVYSRYFDRATNKRNTYWESHLKSQAETSPIREDFQNSLAFKVYVEPDIKIDAATAPVAGEAKAGDDPF